MNSILNLKGDVLSGKEISKEEAMKLVEADLEELCEAANEIRQKFCGNTFDICAVVNGKSGKCPENCKFCAQAGCHGRRLESHPLLSPKEILSDGKERFRRGAHHYGIVTSGRKISGKETDSLCEAIHMLKEETGLEICLSLGMMGEEELCRLREAGASRVHNNLESSEKYFPRLCTTHTWRDKVAVIQSAQKAGFSICSGGVMGVGESMEDRIDMALALRELNVDSVPVNMLNPIPQTPLENQPVLGIAEMRRIMAIYRFILPDKEIRLAAGRLLMEDLGRACLSSGANASITGDMLTTAGVTMEKDIELIAKLGYEIKNPASLFNFPKL